MGPARYPTERRELVLAGRPASLLVVKNPDSLLDGDLPLGRLPYWAELWPSALALSSHLAAMSLRGERVLELGCGMGLTTVAIARAGGVPIAVDYDPDAVRFARRNLDEDGGRGLVARMDWNSLGLGTAFSYVVGADILYERAELPRLSELLSRYLTRGGEAILAEPGRELARGFFQNLGRFGLEVARRVPTTIERVTIYHIARKG